MYLRQSLDRDQTKLAVDRQRDDLIRLGASRKVWDDPVEYCDNNISASKGRRPAYEQLCADIRNGAINRVAALDADRLHRQPRELEQFIDLAEKHNVELASVGGDFDLSTEQGQYYARLEAARSRRAVQQKSARQKAANKERAKAGKPWVTRPFGYTYEAEKDAAGKVIKAWNEIVPHEAEAIRKACDALINGATLYSIAAQWNSAGLKTVKGYLWTGGTVRQVLLRPRNAALAVYGVHATGAAAKNIRESVLEGVETSWPAIVSVDVWQQVCSLLADPKRHTGKSPGRKHLLTGIALCGVCGKGIGTAVRKTKSGKKPVYHCKQPRCAKIVRDLEKVDQLVIDVITRRLARPDAAVVLSKPTVDTKAVRDEINRLEGLIREANAEYDEGTINGARLRGRTDRLNAKLKPLHEKLIGVNMSRDVKELAGKPDAYERFMALPLDRRRGVIDTLAVVTIRRQVKGGRFDPKSVTVEPK